MRTELLNSMMKKSTSCHLSFYKKYAYYMIDGDTGEILSVMYDEVEY